MYKNLQKQYDYLESLVHYSLRQEIVERPDEPREDYDFKVKQVDVFGYTHITLIDENLVFLDKEGHQYSVYADCDLQDLIEILTNW